MKAVLSLILLGVVACVYAGGYGQGYNSGQFVYPHYQYQYYKPAYAQLRYVQQPLVAVGQGGSGNLFYGSDTGSVLPLLLIRKNLKYAIPM